MSRNYFVSIAGIALLCLLLIFVSLWQEIDTPVTKDPITPPNIGPYKSQIVGVGIAEPSSNNIRIGTTVNRIVENVLVKVGEKVGKSEALFSLENRDLIANLNLQQASYESALAKLQKLKILPQPEDLIIAEVNLNNAKIALESAKNQNEMVVQLTDQRAISQEEKNRRMFAYRQAEGSMNQAQASFDKVKSGVWKPDLEIAELEVQYAKANVDVVNTEIERMIIRSPIDGTVLQINVREGELPSLDTFRSPLMIVGNVDEMNLRVSINQLAIPLFSPEAPAIAYSQGDSKVKYALEFVRVEPFLVTKQNITNDINEKIDTRVLHIIYRIKDAARKVFVGQQMDVFIDTEKAQGK